MASVMTTISEKLKKDMDLFPWVNWSEVGREAVQRKGKLQLLIAQLESQEEKELNEWSIQLGQKTKRGTIKRLRKNKS